MRNAVTIILLVVGLLAAAAWVRSRFTTDVLERHYQDADGTMRYYVMGYADSVLAFRYTRINIQNPEGIHRPYWKFGTHRAMTVRTEGRGIMRRLGFLAAHAEGARGRNSYATVPLWLVCLTTLGYPAWRVVRFRARRRRWRRARGLCEACGYDLRASSGRCPECASVQATSSPGAASSHDAASHAQATR